MHDAESRHFWHGDEIHRRLNGGSKRAFRTDENLCQTKGMFGIATVTTVGSYLFRAGIGNKLVKIIAGDAAQDARVSLPNLIGVFVTNAAELAIDVRL